MPFDRELIFGDPEDLHQLQHRNSNSFQQHHQLDLTLPTPPRSPRGKNSSISDNGNMMMGGSSTTIPDSVMDDLFNLLGEDNNDPSDSSGALVDDLFGGLSSFMGSSSGSGGGSLGRKRKISDSWFNLEHHELFGQIAESFSTQNHHSNNFKFNETFETSSSSSTCLLDSLMSSTYSPPPTQPPSPMSTPCKSSSSSRPLSPSSMVGIKSEPPTQPGSIVSDDEYQSGVVDDDDLDGDADAAAADFLADFDNFDSFEKLAFGDDDDEEDGEEEEDDYKPPVVKRSKFDSESSTNSDYFNIKKENGCGVGSLDQIMWNCNAATGLLDTSFIKEEKIEVEQVEDGDGAIILMNDITTVDNTAEVERINSLRAAFNNDHSYACVNNTETVLIKQEDNKNSSISIGSGGGKHFEVTTTGNMSGLNFDKMGIKKTKILVPLKDLMESLQQKSYLVSPLGPGKKIITLTNGETVKGVLTSCPSAKSALASSSSSKPSNHNVRKRPHHPLKFTNPRLLLSDEEGDNNSCSSSSNNNNNQHLHQQQQQSSSSSQLDSCSPTSSKKKTKAHNNMERMRRIDLRNSFDNLKKLVPVLAKSPKCSKVEILKKAEEYIRGLRGLEKKLQKEEQQLRLKLQQNKLRQEQAVAEQQLLLCA